VRFQVSAPENTTLDPKVNLSPDGRKLAFISGGRLWVHFLESGESHDLTAESSESSPFWSPDSRFIGYAFENKLKKIEAIGGPTQTVSDLPGQWGGGAWNKDGVIVFGSPNGLFSVPASGGVPTQITAVNPTRQEIFHAGPSFLPDGQHFIYFAYSINREESAIYICPVDAKPGQQSSKFLLASHWTSEYAPSADSSIGYLLFMRESTLMAAVRQPSAGTERAGDSHCRASRGYHRRHWRRRCFFGFIQ
jgi:hypothetical protein